jgi:hypothetical protein
MTTEDLTSKFFNFLENCPNEIPDCSSLRQEYMQTLDAMKRKGGCSSCAERNLRNTFIDRIKSLLKK